MLQHTYPEVSNDSASRFFPDPDEPTVDSIIISGLKQMESSVRRRIRIGEASRPRVQVTFLVLWPALALAAEMDEKNSAHTKWPTTIVYYFKNKNWYICNSQHSERFLLKSF